VVKPLKWRLTLGACVALCGLKLRMKDPMKGRLFVTASVLVLAACSSKTDTMNDELKKDLDIAASNDGLSLTSNGQGQQVVSTIEQAPPAPKKIAASQRAVRRRQADTDTPSPVEADAGVPTSETEMQSVDEAPIATTNDAPVAPRPTPAATRMPGGNGEGRGGSGVGSGIGIGIEIMGVVLRGGNGGEDHCEPPGRRTHRVPPPISINSRIPIIRGTFPGSGRIR
jgi:hypothetical protein